MPPGVPERLPVLQQAGWWTVFGAFVVGTSAGVFAGLAERQEDKATRLASRFDLDSQAQLLYEDEQDEYERLLRRGEAFQNTAIGLGVASGVVLIAGGHAVPGRSTPVASRLHPASTHQAPRRRVRGALLMERAIFFGLVAGLLASVACFSAPSADVQFSCDLDDAPACPDGYTCRDDGCCHRDGSDFEANEGGCRLVGTSGADTDTLTGTSSATDSTTASATDTTMGTDTTLGTDTTMSTDNSSATDTDGSGTDATMGTDSGSGTSSGTDSGTG